MKVLLSIKPEFASKIFDGSKRYEYRRVIFKNQEVSRIIVYASDPIKRIIGEFEIEDILQDEPWILWLKTKNYAGISKKRFFEYFTNKSQGYAIKIKTTRMYNYPLSLNSFMISSPPQSFIYLKQPVGQT
jgi:predicted transcriptional regulator